MKLTQDICPICGDGHLTESTSKNSVEYKDRSTELDMLYSVCDVCGSEQAAAIQLRANKRAMMAFKKQVDGLLTGVEVRALRERLGVNQAQAAKIFGGGPVAFSKYESDDVAQSEAMDKLLQVTLEFPQVFTFLAQKAEVRFPKDHTWQTLAAERTPTVRPSLHVISSSNPEADRGWRKAG